MRTGVKQSLVEEAIATATDREIAAVRHAGMLLGDLAQVVDLARQDALSTARFQMFHPLGFMLATPAANAEEAYARFAAEKVETSAPSEPTAQIEDKYDGMRAQVHCGDPQQPGRVRIFSRTREDVTASFPELAEWFSAVKTPAILDGEILAWDYMTDRALPVYIAAAPAQPQTRHRRHASRRARRLHGLRPAFSWRRSASARSAASSPRTIAGLDSSALAIRRCKIPAGNGSLSPGLPICHRNSYR